MLQQEKRTQPRRSQGLLIKQVHPCTIASELGLTQGDRIYRINGFKVFDRLDLEFYSSESNLDLEIIRNDGEIWEIEIEKDEDEALGVEVPILICRACGNKCVFCFADQNPSHLRKPLFFKDEDYRFSFLYGHYVTLGNLCEDELDRIIRLRFSPLYISIHATQNNIRRKLLGNPKAKPILPILKELQKGGISFHGQIVTCPGINDGHVLTESLAALADLIPQLQSLAVIPVGITSHRSHLSVITAPSKSWASEILDRVHTAQAMFPITCLAPSDEFFLLAERAIPDAGFYGDYPQLENGVGVLRKFINEAQKYNGALDGIDLDSAIIVTGVSAAPFLRKIVQDWGGGERVVVSGIENILFGASVTVAGLVSGQAIVNAIQKRVDPGSWVIIPRLMINQDSNLFLDNMHIDEINQILGCRVSIIDSEVDSLFNLLRTNGNGEAYEAS